MNEELTENSWVRIKRKKGLLTLYWGPATGHLARRSKQMKPSTKTVNLSFTNLVFMGAFNNSDIIWRDKTEGPKQSRRSPRVC